MDSRPNQGESEPHHDPKDVLRGELQRKAGLDPFLDAETLKDSKSPLFHHTSTDEGVPKGHTPVNHYRYFVIDVELLEHAFNGSYSLSLTGPSGERIGGVDVFTHGGYGRIRAADATVKGVIPMYPKTLLHVLEKHGWENEGVDIALSHFKGSVIGELKKAGGELIAHAHRGTTSTPLPAYVTPRVTLRSAFAAHPDGWKKGPMALYGWQEHGHLFVEGSWYSV